MGGSGDSGGFSGDFSSLTFARFLLSSPKLTVMPTSRRLRSTSFRRRVSALGAFGHAWRELVVGDPAGRSYRDEPRRELSNPQHSIPAVPLTGPYALPVPTQFLRIIHRAGVAPWERLFQNLRATRQTELGRRHPIEDVCAWMGVVRFRARALGPSPKCGRRSRRRPRNGSWRRFGSTTNERIRRTWTKTCHWP